MNPTLRNDSGTVDQTALRENKLGLVERLADDLAHEIKNPLHSMVINLEVLRRRIARLEGVAGGDDLLRYAGVIGTELERVNRRVELLLRMIRPQRETEDLTTIAEIIEELRELAELECEKQAVTLRMEVPEVIARADVPRSRGRQLLLSLLLHTLDTAPAGGMLEIRAEITAAASTVRINLRTADDQPAPVDTEDDRHGYLAVSRSIAERLGGRVEVTESAGPEHARSPEAPSGYLLTLPR